MSRYLNTNNAAELLGASRPTLARWRIDGYGPPFKKIGRRVIYDVAELESWLALKSFQSTSEYPSK